MKKLIGLGTIIASIAPTLLVVACVSDNNSDNVTQTKYQPLAVGVELRNLNDEDLWVFSSALGVDRFGRNTMWPMNDEEEKLPPVKAIKKYRDRISSYISQSSHNIVYITVPQENYDAILKLGRDILQMKNWVIPYLKKNHLQPRSMDERYLINLTDKFYDHYKNSTIKNKINKKFISDVGNDAGKISIAKWL